MDYYNQKDHPLLDRQAIREILLHWTQARVSAAPVEQPRAEHLTQLSDWQAPTWNVAGSSIWMNTITVCPPTRNS